MSYFDDFDPDFHTEEEIRAHYEARYEADEAFRLTVDELAEMDANMDTQQQGLERLAEEDFLGLCMFGDRPGWIDTRLSRKPPK